MPVADSKPSDLIRRDGESADAFLRRVSERFPQSASDNQDQTRTAISGLLADGDTTALLRQRALNGLERDAARTGMSSAEFLRRAQAIREAVPSSIPKDATKVAALPLPIFWLITYGMPLAAGSFFLQQNRDRLIPRGFVTPGPDDTPRFPSSGFRPETVETEPERFPEVRRDPRDAALNGPDVQPASPNVLSTPDIEDHVNDGAILQSDRSDLPENWPTDLAHPEKELIPLDRKRMEAQSVFWEEQGRKHDAQRREQGVDPVPSLSSFWKSLRPDEGRARTNGLTGKKKRLYEWDYENGEIEVYTRHKRHLGPIDPYSLRSIKKKVKSRTLGASDIEDRENDGTGLG